MTKTKRFFLLSLTIVIIALIVMILWQWPNIKQWWRLDGQFQANTEERDTFWQEHGYYPMNEGESFVNEIPEEDFTVIGDVEGQMEEENHIITPEESGWNPQALPEEDFVMDKDAEEDLQIIYHYRDGYRLELPKHLLVSAWELEPDQVTIFEESDAEYDCSAYTYKLEGETVQESFQISFEYQKELDGIGYNILRHELERIEDPNITKEAYISHFEEDMFGYQPSIMIQGDGESFGISQKGQRYPECDLMMRVLKGFKFINET